MPSVAEIFIVAGEAVGTSVDVAFGVDVNGICVGIGAEVAIKGVAVAPEGVAVPWQAASKKTETRKGVIFFIAGY
jgi:hypothetical protein